MKRRHRRHSTAKKREIVEAYLNGEALHALSKQHDVCRRGGSGNLNRSYKWIFCSQAA